MLNRFLALYLLELRLTCFHWGYLLAQVVWGVFLIGSYVNDSLFSVQSMLFAVQGFLSLIALFLTGIQAGRLQRSRFDLLEVAFPTGVETVFARWLSSMTAAAGFLVVPLVLAVISAPYQYSLDFLPGMLAAILTLTAFLTGLIWLVQHTIGIRRWMYPFFVVFWIGSGFIPNMTGSNYIPFPGSTLLNFVTMDRPIGNALWGSLQQGNRPQLFLIFYFGIVLLFGGVMVWRYIQRCFYRRSLLALGLMVLALVVMLAAGGSYTADAYAANQAVVEETQNFNLQAFTLASDLPYHATSYDLTFALDDVPRFTAIVEVMNRSETPLTELEFSINRQFELTHVSHPFERDEDYVTVQVSLNPDETAQITFEYQGSLWIVGRQLGRAPEATEFIHPDGVYLTCDALWYPIAGRIIPHYTPYAETGLHKRHCLLDQPARFRLAIEQDGGLTFVSNLVDEGLTLTSEGAVFVELIGATQLETVKRQSITIVGQPNKLDVIADKIETVYTPAYEHLRRFFPDAPPLKIMVMDVGPQSFNGWSSYPVSAESVYLSFPPRSLDWFGDYRYLGQPMVEGVLGTGYNSLMDSISYFIWVHYQAKGDIEQMRQLLRVDVPMHFAYMPELLSPALALFDVYSEKGEAALIDLLREIRANFETLASLPPDEMIKWIQER